MTPFALTILGAAVCVAAVLAGLCFAVASDPRRSPEPIGTRVCLLIAALGMVLMFGATVAEIALRIFAP